MRFRITTSVLRIINRLGGKYGEYAAGLLLGRIPSRWVSSSGAHHVSRNGLNWVLDLEDNLQKRLYLVGSYESLTLDAIFAKLRPDDVVLDVGANIGAIALPIAKKLRGSGHVIAVEPAKDTAARLRMHVAMNGLNTLVDVIEVALSDREGEARLLLGDFGPGDIGTRTLEGDLPPDGDPVRIMTGDSLRRQLGVDRFDVIKVDVEGHERFVLSGLTETFTISPPRLVVLEVVAEHQKRAGGSPQLLLNLMRSMGYRGLAIRNRGLGPITCDFSGNAIFELPGS